MTTLERTRPVGRPAYLFSPFACVLGQCGVGVLIVFAAVCLGK